MGGECLEDQRREHVSFHCCSIITCPLHHCITKNRPDLTGESTFSRSAKTSFVFQLCSELHLSVRRNASRCRFMVEKISHRIRRHPPASTCSSIGFSPVEQKKGKTFVPCRYVPTCQGDQNVAPHRGEVRWFPDPWRIQPDPVSVSSNKVNVGELEYAKNGSKPFQPKSWNSSSSSHLPPPLSVPKALSKRLKRSRSRAAVDEPVSAMMI